jgi:hypothetical protein
MSILIQNVFLASQMYRHTLAYGGKKGCVVSKKKMSGRIFFSSLDFFDFVLCLLIRFEQTLVLKA